MAEIRDVYGLDFDSARFSQEVQSAIQQVDELSAALENGAASTEDMEAATSQLINSLKTEATGAQNLNAKRNALVSTQQTLNKESKAGVAVSNQLVATNRQIAVTTGQATTSQRSFFGGLVQGAQRINSMRRAASLLGGALRLITGIGIGTLLAQAIPAVIGLFGRLIGATKETKSELDKLNDPDTALLVQQRILQSEIQRLDTIKAKNGQLNEEQQQQRDDLVQKYQSTSDEIEKIESERIANIQKLEFDTARIRIKLLTDASQRASATAALDIAELSKNAGAQQNAIFKEINRLVVQRDKERAAGFVDNANRIEQEIELLQKQGDALNEKFKAEKLAIAEDKKNNLTRIQQQQLLSTSLAALEKELSRLRKIQSDQTNALSETEIKAIQDRIDAQQVQVDKAKALLADIQGIEKAKANIYKLTTDLIVDDVERRTVELQAAAEKERADVVGTEEQKAEQIRLINEKLSRDLAEIRNKTAADQQAAARKIQEDTIARIEAAFDTDKALEATRLSIALQGIEARRNAELNNVALLAAETPKQIEARNKAVEAVNKRYDAERVAAEKRNQAIILQAEIEAVQNILEVRAALGESTVAQTAEIEKLKLQLVELQKTNPTIEIDADKTESEIKKLVTEIVGATLQIQKVIFDAVDQGYQRLIARLDESVAKSKGALDEIRQNSEDYNARQLEIEKDRLEKLEKERAQAIQRQKTLAIVQIAIDTAVAVAKTASQSGVAAPITIATTLAAIVGGIGAAIGVAQGANFFEGSEFVDKEGRYPVGRDQVPARLNKGERVITTATNQEYYKSLSAIHHHRVPAGVLNNFVQNWDKPANVMKQVDGRLGFVVVPNDNSDLRAELSAIREALSSLTTTNVTVKANANGIFKVVERRQKQVSTMKRIVNG